MSQTFVCEACGAKVTSLRRGRCSVCYLRWANRRPIGIGASCVICSERRRDNLRMVEFNQNWLPMCHNCSSLAFRLSPMPRTLEALRQTLSRDRRWSARRRSKQDNRVFQINRRSEERRAGERGIDAEWIDAADLIIEISDIDPQEEATRIVTMHKSHPPPLPIANRIDLSDQTSW